MARKKQAPQPANYDYPTPFSSGIEQQTPEYQRKQFNQMTHDMSFSGSAVLSAGKTFEQGILNTVGFMRAAADKLGVGVDQDPKTFLPPQKLNELFPGLSKPFTEAMPLETASFMAISQRKRSEDEALLSMASPGGRFFGGLAGAMADPINLAGFVVGAGALRAAGLTAEAALAAKYGDEALAAAQAAGAPIRASLAQRLGYGAAEGLVGAVPTELAMQASFQEQGIPRTLGDTALEVAQSTVLGAGFGGLHKGVEKIYDRFRYGAQGGEARFAISKMFRGQDPDINPSLRERFKQSGGEQGFNPSRTLNQPDVPSNVKTVNYEFKPVRTNGQFDASRKFFIPVDEDGVPLKVSDDFGTDVYASDNPYVANSNASVQTGGGGAVKAVDIDSSNMKILDLNDPLPKDVMDVVSPYYAALVGEKKATEDLMEKSGREILSSLQAKDLDDEALTGLVDGVLNPKLKALGYDGYLHSGGGPLDDGKNHNVLALFDESKLKNSELIEPDHDSIYKADDVEVAQQMADRPEKKFQYQFNDQAFVNELGQSTKIPPDTSQLKQMTEEFIPNLDMSVKQLEVADQGMAQRFKAELEKLKQDLSMANKQDLQAQALRLCVSRGA